MLPLQRRNPHHPPHWFVDDTWYALTACTYQRQAFLAPDEHKVYMRDVLQSLILEFHLSLAAWVILNDHYHLLVRIAQGDRLSEFVRRLHGNVSHAFNKRDAAQGRRVWQNYWDTCVRDECGFWSRFNYIHHNPMKHGLAREMGDYAFSSYPYYQRTQGEAWLADVFTQYPVRDFTDSGDVVLAKTVG